MQDKVEKVLGIMVRARRRLLLVRAVEYSAVLVVAAGLCAAAMEIAWALAPIHIAAAMPVCLLPAAGGALLLQRFIRRAPQFAGGLAWLAAALCFASSAVGCVYLFTERYAEIPKLFLPAILMPVGIAVGIVVAIVTRPSLYRTGVLLDLRLGLAERLSTAAELAVSSKQTSPSIEAVYCQAVEAAERNHAVSVSLWNRSRATAGAVGLVVMLCVVLGLLPGEISDVKSLDTLSAEQLQKMAKDFRLAAEQNADNKELSEAFVKAAVAVEVKDEEELQRLLDKLRDAGVKLYQVTDPELLAAAGLGAAGDGDSPVADNTATEGNGTELTSTTSPDGSGDRSVGVYDPLYTELINSGADTTRPDRQVSPVISYETAWEQSRRRAESALAGGRVPARYRDLVRRYFHAD